MLSAAAHGRSPEWAEGQRLACVGARGRPLRLGLRCLSLQFTSPSARFCVATFISGSKVLHTLAPWWSGTRRYTLLGLGCFSFIFRIHAVFFLSCQFGVIPTGVRLFFFYFLIFFKMQTWTRRFELGIGYGSKKKRNFVVCAAPARARSISHTSTHIFTAAVSARGGAAAG